MFTRTVLGLLMILAMSASSQAAKPPATQKTPPKPKAETFLTVEQAGPDYAIQGEYEGAAGETKIGVQVIALGAGAFRAVLFEGGLPGAGADMKSKVESAGKTEGDKTVFGADGKGFSATQSAGAISGKTPKGVAFEARRVDRHSPTLGAKAPEGAVVLFDGTSADAWVNAKMDERKLLAAGSPSKQAFGACTLHVEFFLPFKPAGRGQDRGNSGVYMQHRYEIQVLDSFGLAGLDNECGGIYKVAAPKVNMCLPPLQWQTYDIDFTPAEFDAAGKKTKSATVTIRHNGVTIHENQEIPGPTGGGKKEDATPGPVYLQGHGNPVFYRNVWVLERK